MRGEFFGGLFTLTSMLLSLPAAAGGSAPASAGSPGAKLPPGAGAAISRAIGADEPGYFPRREGHGYRFENGNLSAELSRAGAKVTLAKKALAFVLTGYGRDGAVRPPTAATPRAHGNRVEYDRAGLTEWYANGPGGIEQGFTIARAPKGSGRLRLEMAVSGGGEAEVEAGGTAVSWSVGGKAWLEYLGLSAFDVAGRSLPARLDTSASGLSIEVDDVGAAYPVIVDPFIQEAKLSASDGVVGDQLGFSVAIWGNTVVAGDPMATIGGNPFQGAAYVFVEPGTGWANATETAKLTASDGAVSDGFGFSVAISGNTIVVGEPTGSAVAGVSYVFVKPGTGWAGSLHEAARLTPSDLAASNFGFSVAISGSTVVAGAPVSSSSRGAVYVFVEPGTGWTGDLDETARLTASDGASLAYFGSSVGISGDTVVAGAPFAKVGSHSFQGAAYVFVEPGTGWAGDLDETARLSASDGAGGDELGYSVAISGNTVVAGAVSANSRGAAYVFVEPGTGWAGSVDETARLSASDAAVNNQFGFSVAISGDTVVAGMPGSNANHGAAYVFAMPAAGWASTSTFDAKLTADDGVSHDVLGVSVAISGDTVVAGATGANGFRGAAYVFAGPPACASPSRRCVIPVSEPSAAVVNPRSP